jgi:hypothetical protein
MEQGNLVEFRGEADPKSFQEAFRRLEGSLGSIDKAVSLYDDLIAKVEKDPGLPVFRRTLSRLLNEAGTFERIRERAGARYSNLGARGSRRQPPAVRRFQNLAGLMKAQREDLVTLRKLTADTVESFKGVLPRTERGEFVSTMLSGRSPFSEHYEELVDARSTFGHFYTRGCMVSIQAVMQVYPAGFEFLKRPATAPGN